MQTLERTEIWKRSHVSDCYEVSNLGRIRSLTRLVNTAHNANRMHYGRILKPFFCNGTGYLQVMIHRKKYSVHRLVAQLFCEKRSESHVVNHINGKRDDNRASNLEWITTSENVKHGYRSLGRVAKMLGVKGESHPKSKAVVAFYPNGDVYRRFGSAMDAVRIGFDSSCITRCCQGKNSSHKGLNWEYEHNLGWSEPEESSDGA